MSDNGVVNGRGAEERACGGCGRVLAISEFEDGVREFKRCHRCREQARAYKERVRLGTQERVEVDAGVTRRLEAMGQGARASWEELAGLPGGFRAVPARQRPGDGDRRWWQLV